MNKFTIVYKTSLSNSVWCGISGNKLIQKLQVLTLGFLGYIFVLCMCVIRIQRALIVGIAVVVAAAVAKHIIAYHVISWHIR